MAPNRGVKRSAEQRGRCSVRAAHRRPLTPNVGRHRHVGDPARYQLATAFGGEILYSLHSILKLSRKTCRMAKPNYAFAKRQKDLAKKQKKEEKRLRKIGTSETQPQEAQQLPLDDAKTMADGS